VGHCLWRFCLKVGGLNIHLQLSYTFKVQYWFEIDIGLINWSNDFASTSFLRLRLWLSIQVFSEFVRVNVGKKFFSLIWCLILSLFYSGLSTLAGLEQLLGMSSLMRLTIQVECMISMAILVFNGGQIDQWNSTRREENAWLNIIQNLLILVKM